MPKERDDRRVFQSRPLSAAPRPGSGQSQSVMTAPSQTHAPRTRKRKAVSVYLDQPEAESVRAAATYYEREMSDFMRRAILFEIEFGLGQLRRMVEQGDPDAGLLLIERALLLADRNLSELLPPPPPPPEPVEVIRYLPAPLPRPVEPAVLPASRPEPVVIAAPLPPPISRHENRHAGTRVRAERSGQTGTGKPAANLDLVRLATKVLRSSGQMALAVIEVFGWFAGLIGVVLAAFVRGILRAGPRSENRLEEPERWSSGSLIMGIALFAAVIWFLPIDFGRGWIGYRLLGGDERAVTEVLRRSPAKYDDRVG